MQNRLSRTAPGVGGGGSGRQDQPTDQDVDSQVDVLGILEDIESQFDRLKTIRSEQVDSLRELSVRSSHIEEQKAALDLAREELERHRKDLDRKQQQDQASLDESRKCLEADRESHVRRVDQDKSTLERDRESLNEVGQRHRKEADARRMSLDQERAALDQLNQELKAQASSIEADKADLESRRQRIDQEAVANERRQQDLLDALLVARKTIDYRGRRVRAFDELVTALRRDRRKLRSRRRGLEAACRVQRKRMTEFKHQFEAQNERLVEAGVRMKSFMELLREQADLVQRGNAAITLVDSLESRIHELETELATHDRTSSGSDRIASLEQELKSTREELARNAVDQVATSVAEDRSRRLSQVARQLHLRRSRLRKIRSAMKSRSQVDHGQHASVEQRLRQSEVIEQRQQELDNVKRMLVSSEKMMIKRWAVPRSIELISWSVLLIAILAAASWGIANRIKPVIQATSVTIAPRVPDGTDLDMTRASEWHAFHESQLLSTGFAEDVARRTSARRLSPLDTRDSVRQMLASGITTDSGEPSRLVLTLVSGNPFNAAAFLDVLATSMVIDAHRTMASRPGGYATRLPDDRKQDGELRYSRINPTPIKDERVMTASVIFGGGLLLTFMVIAVVYSRLIRAKKIFDAAHPDDISQKSMLSRPI